MGNSIESQINNECGKSVYGPDAYCGFGKCVIVNPSMSYCDCNEGFGNDFTFTRHPNCYLPDGVVPILTWIILILLVLMLAYGVQTIRNSKSTARWIAASLSLGIFVRGLIIASFWAAGYVWSILSFFFFWVVIGVIELSLWLSVYSMMVPLHASLNRDISPYVRGSRIFFVVFRVLTFVPLAFAFNFDDITSSAKNLYYSYALESIVFFAGVEVVVIYAILLFYANSMERMILAFANIPKPIHDYLGKLRWMKSRTLLCATTMGSILLGSSSLHFITGSLPMVFAMMFAGFFNIIILELLIIGFIRQTPGDSRGRQTLNQAENGINRVEPLESKNINQTQIDSAMMAPPSSVMLSEFID